MARNTNDAVEWSVGSHHVSRIVGRGKHSGDSTEIGATHFTVVSIITVPGTKRVGERG